MIPHATPEKPGKNAHSGEGAAQGAAVGAANAPLDPRLASIIEAWPRLPEDVRAEIWATVQRAS